MKTGWLQLHGSFYKLKRRNNGKTLTITPYPATGPHTASTLINSKLAPVALSLAYHHNNSPQSPTIGSSCTAGPPQLALEMAAEDGEGLLSPLFKFLLDSSGRCGAAGWVLVKAWIKNSVRKG